VSHEPPAPPAISPAMRVPISFAWFIRKSTTPQPRKTLTESKTSTWSICARFYNRDVKYIKITWIRLRLWLDSKKTAGSFDPAATQLNA